MNAVMSSNLIEGVGKGILGRYKLRKGSAIARGLVTSDCSSVLKVEKVIKVYLET